MNLLIFKLSSDNQMVAYWGIAAERCKISAILLGSVFPYRVNKKA